jgi:hypothetical protein
MALEQQMLSQISALNQNVSQLVQKTATITTLHSYTVAQANALVGVATGAQAFITNEAGGAQPASFDGTNWRRYTDRAVIS